MNAARERLSIVINWIEYLGCLVDCSWKKILSKWIREWNEVNYLNKRVPSQSFYRRSMPQVLNILTSRILTSGAFWSSITFLGLLFTLWCISFFGYPSGASGRYETITISESMSCSDTFTGVETLRLSPFENLIEAEGVIAGILKYKMLDWNVFLQYWNLTMLLTTYWRV